MPIERNARYTAAPCISGCDLYRIAFFALKATMVEDSESRGEHLEHMKAIHKGPAPKFKRHDPQLGRICSEAALFEEMEHAAELLQHEEDFGRSGTHHALHACYSFLHARGLSGQGLKPMIDLMAALESVASGVLPELFDPKLKPGQMPERKWSRSSAVSEVKIHTAACMDALMKSNVGKDEAAAHVARHTANWPRISQGLIKANTVANWRDELLQQGSDDRDRRRFERLSAMFSQGAKAKEHLAETLRGGPVLTGGVRKRR